MSNEGHRKRVKDKFCRTDLKNYYAYEIIEALLFGVIRRRDTKPIAKELIKKFGTVNGVFAATKSEFLSCKGVGEKSYMFLKLFNDIWQYSEKESQNCQRIVNARGAGLFALSYLRECETQKMYIVLVDPSHRVIITREIKETAPDKRLAEIVRNMGKYGKITSEVVIMYNHTDGSLIPTNEEKVLVKKVRNILRILNIKLKANVLVSGEKYIIVDNESTL